MKKLLSILLALTMVFSLAACGGDKAEKEAKKGEKVVDVVKDDEKTKEKDDEALAEETVEGAMDAFCELNLKEFAGYVNGEADLGDMPFENKDDLTDMFLEELGSDPGMEGMIELIQPVFETVVDAMLDSMTYEITDVSEDNGDYNFTVNFECMDFEALDDFDSLMEGTDFETTMMEVVTELMESGDITEDMSEEEMMEALIPSLVEILEDVIVEALESVDTNEAELEFVVTEEDGEWLIDAENSNVDALVELFSGLE